MAAGLFVGGWWEKGAWFILPGYYLYKFRFSLAKKTND